MKKQIYRVGAVFLAGILFALSGCGEAKKAEGVSEQEVKSTISFSWWGNDERHRYTLAGMDAFQKKYPQIDVVESYSVWEGYERRNRIAMRAGISADVMLVNYSWLKTYSEDGEGYYDLNELSDVIDLSQFTKEDLEIGTRNGHLNALPTAYNMSVMYFNKDLFAEYGMEIPKTWDDLFEAAKRMREDGIYPLGTVKKHVFLLLQAHFEQISGRKLFSEDGKFVGDSRDIQQMLAFYKRLIDEKVLMPLDEFDNNVFLKEKAAGVECWISDLSKYCLPLQKKGRDVVQSGLLGLEDTDTTGWYIKPATMYAVSVDTKYPKDAGRLVEFLLNDPEMIVLQGTEKGVPVSNKALKTLEENNMLDSLESISTEYLNENRESLQTIIPIMENNDIIDGFKKVGDEYIYGQHSLKVCADRILLLIRSKQYE